MTALDALLAARTGHFLLESGHHGELRLELNLLFTDPARVQPLVEELAALLRPHRVDVVCGPVAGGALLGQLVAARLGAGGADGETRGRAVGGALHGGVRGAARPARAAGRRPDGPGRRRRQRRISAPVHRGGGGGGGVAPSPRSARCSCSGTGPPRLPPGWACRWWPGRAGRARSGHRRSARAAPRGRRWSRWRREPGSAGRGRRLRRRLPHRPAPPEPPGSGWSGPPPPRYHRPGRPPPGRQWCGHHDPGLLGRDRGHVVDERGRRRLTRGGQVRDQGDVGPRGQVRRSRQHRVTGSCRVRSRPAMTSPPSTCLPVMLRPPLEALRARPPIAAIGERPTAWSSASSHGRPPPQSSSPPGSRPSCCPAGPDDPGARRDSQPIGASTFGSVEAQRRYAARLKPAFRSSRVVWGVIRCEGAGQGRGA